MLTEVMIECKSNLFGTQYVTYKAEAMGEFLNGKYFDWGIKIARQSWYPCLVAIYFGSVHIDGNSISNNFFFFFTKIEWPCSVWIDSHERTSRLFAYICDIYSSRRCVANRIGDGKKRWEWYKVKRCEKKAPRLSFFHSFSLPLISGVLFSLFNRPIRAAWLTDRTPLFRIPIIGPNCLFFNGPSTLILFLCAQRPLFPFIIPAIDLSPFYQPPFDFQSFFYSRWSPRLCKNSSATFDPKIYFITQFSQPHEWASFYETCKTMWNHRILKFIPFSNSMWIYSNRVCWRLKKKCFVCRNTFVDSPIARNNENVDRLSRIHALIHC